MNSRKRPPCGIYETQKELHEAKKNNDILISRTEEILNRLAAAEKELSIMKRKNRNWSRRGIR